MLLDCQNISKSFFDTPILCDVSFQLGENEHIALVGSNGAGKTTLLNILTGSLSPDRGMVVLAKDKTVGYLRQDATVQSGRSIYEELLAARQDLTDLEARLRDMETNMASETDDALTKLMNDYDTLSALYERNGGLSYKSEILGTLRGLGFSDAEMNRPVDTLSGGQKTRVALSRLLTLKPDLLILDEPTNHLDLTAIAFLENTLLNYKGGVLVVSHDRYFLDRVAQRVLELERTKVTLYVGNYSEYAIKKEAHRNELLNVYYKQQEQIAHEKAVIKKLRQFNREKSIRRAESRVKKLAKIERLEKPAELQDAMSLSLLPRMSSGKDVLTADGLSMRFGERTLFSDLCFSVTRGEHIALIGDNGTGKTTLLKIINGLLAPEGGTLTYGTNVEIAYYDQEQQVLHPEKTLFDELQDDYPAMNHTEIRNALAAFLFTGNDVFKTVGMLSGGEKGRVSLCKLMLSRANFLMLDEPTNHLDIASKEILEDALNSYEGTVLYVSHDRYFINRTASRILELSGNTLTNYLGDYDYYLEKKAESDAAKAPDLQKASAQSDVRGSADPAPLSQGALDYKAQKEEAAAKRKRENDLKKCEDRISVLEEENKHLDDEMAKPEIASSSVRLQELSAKQAQNLSELDGLYALWETLA